MITNSESILTAYRRWPLNDTGSCRKSRKKYFQIQHGSSQVHECIIPHLRPEISSKARFSRNFRSRSANSACGAGVTTSTIGGASTARCASRLVTVISVMFVIIAGGSGAAAATGSTVLPTDAGLGGGTSLGCNAASPTSALFATVARHCGWRSINTVVPTTRAAHSAAASSNLNNPPIIVMPLPFVWLRRANVPDIDVLSAGEALLRAGLEW